MSDLEINSNENVNLYDTELFEYEIKLGNFVLALLVLAGGVLFVVVAFIGLAATWWILFYLITGLTFVLSALYFIYSEIQQYQTRNKLVEYFKEENVDKIANLVENESVADDAVFALGLIRNSKAIDKLFEIFFDTEDTEIRKTVLVQLEQIEESTIINKIEEYLKSTENKDDELFFDVALVHVNMVKEKGIGEEIIRQMIENEELDDEQESEFINALGIRALELESKNIANGISSHISSFTITPKGLEVDDYKKLLDQAIDEKEVLQRIVVKLQDSISNFKGQMNEPITIDDTIKLLTNRLQEEIKAEKINADAIEKISNSIKNLRESSKQGFFEKPIGAAILKVLIAVASIAGTLLIQYAFGFI